MKKFLALTTVLFATTAAMAYTPGELISYDGRTCLVLALDSCGQKALIMAPPAMYVNGKTDKDCQKKIEKDKRFKDFYAAGDLTIIPTAPATPEYKNREKEIEKVVDENKENWNLGAALTGEYTRNGDNKVLTAQDAKEKAVRDYFSAHSLSLADHYPEYRYAESLGEGWFLGSTREFQLYHRIAGNFDDLQQKNKEQAASGHKFFYPLNLRNPFRNRFMYQNYTKRYDATQKRDMYNYQDTFLSDGSAAFKGEWGGYKHYVKIYSKGEKEFGICTIACRWIPNK